MNMHKTMKRNSEIKCQKKKMNRNSNEKRNFSIQNQLHSAMKKTVWSWFDIFNWNMFDGKLTKNAIGNIL